MPSTRINRRAVLGGGAVLVAVAASAGGRAWVTRPAGAGTPDTLTPPEALDAVRAGALTLVDVRRPDEWAATGIAEGAVPIDLRRDDFVQAVRAARDGPDAPVALICARGVRSRRMAARLAEAGIGPIVDVPEGMLGSRAGPGWLARGLPVTRPETRTEAPS